MAEFNIQMGCKKSDGTTDKYNPITKAKNVNIVPKNNIPNTATTIQQVADALGPLAFNNGKNVVYLSDDTTESPETAIESDIDDDNVTSSTTWSSEKITSELGSYLSFEIIE